MIFNDIDKGVIKDFQTDVSLEEIHQKYNIPISTLCMWKAEFNNEVERQIKELDILISDDTIENRNKLFDICDREEFSDVADIAWYKAKWLYHHNEIYKALKVYEREPFLTNPVMQNERVVLLIQIDEDDDKVLDICNKEIFRYDPYIQSQKVKILIKNLHYNEAFKICSMDIFNDNPVIQSQKVLILIKWRDYNQALGVCNRDEFIDNPRIQGQKVDVLIKKHRFEEALDICDREEFKDNKKIQSKRKKILDERKKYASRTSLYIDDISTLFTMIYCDAISIDEIEKSNIEDFKKTLLTLLFYEKHDVKKAISYIKNKIKSSEIESEKRIYNIFYSRVTSKKAKYLDYDFYSQYLNCHLDKKTIEKIKLEKNTEVKDDDKNLEPIKRDIEVNNLNDSSGKDTIKVINDDDVKKIKQGKKYVSSDSLSINRENIPKRIKVIHSKDEYQVVKMQTIQNLFYEYIMELKKIIYCEMNFNYEKEMINAWDVLEELVNRPITDKKSIGIVIDIFEKFNRYGIISINVNDCKEKVLSLNN